MFKESGNPKNLESEPVNSAELVKPVDLEISETLQQIPKKGEGEAEKPEPVFDFKTSERAGELLTEEKEKVEEQIPPEERESVAEVKESFKSAFGVRKLTGAAVVFLASLNAGCGDSPNLEVASAPSIEKKIGREVTGVEKARSEREQAEKLTNEEKEIIIESIKKELAEAKRNLTKARANKESIEKIDNLIKKVKELEEDSSLAKEGTSKVEKERFKKLEEAENERMIKREEAEKEMKAKKEKAEKARIKEVELEKVHELMPLVLRKEEAYVKIQGFREVERKGDNLHVTFAGVSYLVPPDNIPNFLGALKILENERDSFPREKRGEIRWGTRLEGIIKNHGTERTPARSESEFQPKKGRVKSEILPEEKSDSEKLLDEKLKTAEENAIYSMRQYGFEVLKNTSDQLFSIQIDSESYQIHKKNVPKLAEFITGLEYKRKHLYQAWENYKLREVYQLKMRGRFTGAQQKRINGEIRHIERITRADLAGRVKQYIIEITGE